MPCDYKEYPENWKWLSEQLRKDAGQKCDLCFAPNGVLVKRNTKASNYPWQYATEMDITDEEKTTKIILTVHHIDSDKANNKKQNLIVLCQRCHLRLDLLKHMKNRRAARQNNEEAKLQLTTAAL